MSISGAVWREEINDDGLKSLKNRKNPFFYPFFL
jgi:hypothetical protein